ncbi:MAG: hypothetical protein WAW39_12085 [Prosthecobacter sp.]|uniref:hypothetical protein n=1 Tax=Prosthecobacter sp. TaxID=1965333 RepID=UPI003BB19228
MTSHQFIVIMRWLLVPITAALGIIVALVPSFVVNRIVHAILWSTGHHMPGKVFMSYYSIPVCGAFAAFLFVVFGTWAAPKHRSKVAFLLLVIGGALTWESAGDFHAPYIIKGQPYIQVWQPIVATWSGGLLAFVVIYGRAGLRRVFRFQHS